MKFLSSDDHQQRIVLIVAAALLNPSTSVASGNPGPIPYSTLVFAVRVPWDADRFAEKVKITVEQRGETSASNASLEKYFINPKLGTLREPAIIVDLHGHIMLWLLPGILSGRLVCLLLLSVA